MEKLTSGSEYSLSDHLTRCSEYFLYPSVKEAYKLQVEEIISLLQKWPELHAYEIPILRTIERLVIAYAGEERKVEKIGNIARPKVFHHLEVLKIGLLQVDILKHPKQYDMPVRTWQKVDILCKEVEKDLVGYVIGLLHHDSAEDNKFVFVDGKGNHSNTETDRYYLDIKKTMDGDEELLGAYILEKIEYNKLQTIQDKEAVDRLFGKLLQVKSEGILPTTLEGQVVLKCQLSYYHILCAGESDGFTEEQMISGLFHADALTQKKVGKMKIDDDVVYYNRIEQSQVDLLDKLIDTTANSTSISKNSEFYSLKDKQKQQEFEEKYSYRMDWLQTQVPFFLDLTEKTYEYFNYSMDSFMKVVIKTREEIAKITAEPFTRNVAKHHTTVHASTTDYNGHSRGWSKQVVQNTLTSKPDYMPEKKSVEKNPHLLVEDLYFMSKYGFVPKDDVTVMDAYRQPFTLPELRHILTAILGEEIQRKKNLPLHITAQGLVTLNDILNKSLTFYYEEQHLTMPKSCQSKKRMYTDDEGNCRFNLRSGTDLLEILHDAKHKHGVYQTSLCQLLKNAYCYTLLHFSPRVQDYDHKFTELIQQKLFSLFQTKSSLHGENVKRRFDEIVEENKQKLLLRDTLPIGTERDTLTQEVALASLHALKLFEGLLVETSTLRLDEHNLRLVGQGKTNRIMPNISPILIKKLYLRGKGGESVIHRFFRKSEDNLEITLSDLLGARYELHNPQDLMIAMNHYDELIYGGKGIIKAKGIVTSQDVLEGKDHLSPYFFYRLLDAVEKYEKLQKNQGISADEYDDIKISGPVIDDSTYPELESQFVISNERNEQRFSMHPVYSLSKILNTIIRQTGYVHKNYIDHVCLRAAYRYPEVRILGDNDIKKTAQVLSDHICSKFVQMRHHSGSKKTFEAYTSKTRWNILKTRKLLDKSFYVYDPDRQERTNGLLRGSQQDTWCHAIYEQVKKIRTEFEKKLSEDDEEVLHSIERDIKLAIDKFSDLKPQDKQLTQSERNSAVKEVQTAIKQMSVFLSGVTLTD